MKMHNDMEGLNNKVHEVQTLEGMPRRSPLGRVKSLLSSRTEFKFSTHSGSTSPSNMIQCFFVISPRTLSMILKEEEGMNGSVGRCKGKCSDWEE